MPASVDFPRGVILTSGPISGGPFASVTFPALPGIAWVLTHIDATLYLEAVGTFAYVINVTGGVLAGVIVVSNTAAGTFDKDTFEWDGAIQFPVGTAVAVSFNGASSPVLGELINAGAYPT